jgi:hypothetical protein
MHLGAVLRVSVGTGVQSAKDVYYALLCPYKVQTRHAETSVVTVCVLVTVISCLGFVVYAQLFTGVPCVASDSDNVDPSQTQYLDTTSSLGN